MTESAGGPLGGGTPREDLRYQKASGGYLWHMVPQPGRTALCGFAPTSLHGPYSVSSRGCWKYVYSELGTPCTHVCPACKRQQQRQLQQVPPEGSHP